MPVISRFFTRPGGVGWWMDCQNDDEAFAELAQYPNISFFFEECFRVPDYATKGSVRGDGTFIQTRHRSRIAFDSSQNVLAAAGQWPAFCMYRERISSRSGVPVPLHYDTGTARPAWKPPSLKSDPNRRLARIHGKSNVETEFLRNRGRRHHRACSGI
jgi:hypothetical protein